MSRSTIAAFAKEELGLELFPEQASVLERFEGGPFRQLVLQIGRRSGKSLLADVLALYDALVRDLAEYLRPGEQRIVAIVATRQEQASEHITNIRRLIEQNPRLRAMVTKENNEEVQFVNGSVIRTYPCSARAIRGGAFSSAILDEFGHFENVEKSNSAGEFVLRAVRPSMAQFKKLGWLIVISTPLWRDTAFGRLVDQAQSGRHPWQLYIHRTTAQMRPDIAESGLLDEERQLDPDAFALEYDAEFGAGAGAYLDPQDVVSAVRAERNVIEPKDELRYVAALDPAFSVDRFAMAVGHKDAGDGRAIIDGVWVWHKAGYEATLNEVANVCRAYRLTEVTTDQYAVEAIREGLARRQIHGDYVPWTSESKSNAFGRLKLGLNNRTVEIPDDPALVEELCGLEARPTPAGFTRIAARPGRHDDRAIVVASVVNSLQRPNDVAVIFAGMENEPSEDDELDAWTRRMSGTSILG